MVETLSSPSSPTSQVSTRGGYGAHLLRRPGPPPRHASAQEIIQPPPTTLTRRRTRRIHLIGELGRGRRAREAAVNLGGGGGGF
jgi:hypothetical protein